MNDAAIGTKNNAASSSSMRRWLRIFPASVESGIASLEVQASEQRQRQQRKRPPLDRVGEIPFRRNARWAPVAKIAGTGISIQKQHPRLQGCAIGGSQLCCLREAGQAR